MPNPSSSRSLRLGREEKSLPAPMITQKSYSFHGQSLAAAPPPMRRPKTQPDLKAHRGTASAALSSASDASARPPKLLFNVTVQRSLGPVKVLMPPDATVGDLVAEAVRSYSREGRRPLLPTADPAGFDLHYSQFCLESLDPKEKLMGSGSRNFFLSPKPLASLMASCSGDLRRASNAQSSWLGFLHFLR